MTRSSVLRTLAYSLEVLGVDVLGRQLQMVSPETEEKGEPTQPIQQGHFPQNGRRPESPSSPSIDPSSGTGTPSSLVCCLSCAADDEALFAGAGIQVLAYSNDDQTALEPVSHKVVADLPIRIRWGIYDLQLNVRVRGRRRTVRCCVAMSLSGIQVKGEE